MIDSNTSKQEIVRFYHITFNSRQKHYKFGQNSYKNCDKDSFFPMKKEIVEYDKILKDSFLTHRNYYLANMYIDKHYGK